MWRKVSVTFPGKQEVSSYEQAVWGTVGPGRGLTAFWGSPDEVPVGSQQGPKVVLPVLQLHKELPDAISVRGQQTLPCSASAANLAWIH